MNPVFAVRPGRQNDANEILDIDIKAFENAWGADEWARIGFDAEYAISVLSYFGTAVGFIVMRRGDLGIELLKMAVKEQYRLKGCSRLLIQAVEEYARKERNEVVYTIIPEHHVYPGHENLSVWLSKLGFTPTKPFIKKHFTAYGESEDGVKFTRTYRSPL